MNIHLTNDMPKEGSIRKNMRKQKHMCTKNADNTRKKSQHSFYKGMEEMMNHFCSSSDWNFDYCPQHMRMSRFNTNSEIDFMSMCEKIKKKFFHLSKNDGR